MANNVVATKQAERMRADDEQLTVPSVPTCVPWFSCPSVPALARLHWESHGCCFRSRRLGWPGHRREVPPPRVARRVRHQRHLPHRTRRPGFSQSSRQTPPVFTPLRGSPRGLAGCGEALSLTPRPDSPLRPGGRGRETVRLHRLRSGRGAPFPDNSGAFSDRG